MGIYKWIPAFAGMTLGKTGLIPIFSLTMFLPTVFSEKGKVYFLSVGIMLVMYVFKIVANLQTDSEALMKNTIEGSTYLFFIGVALVFLFLGALRFIKRDVAV